MQITEVTISIDGSALNNGQPGATAGYGVVVELDDVVAELKSALCPKCDYNLYTNNRAELRAAETAIKFLHELAKNGHHKSCQFIGGRRGRRGDAPTSFLSDGRSIDASSIRGVIRTDSTFVLKGATGANRQIRHKDIWENVNRCMSCSTKAGMDIRFDHVRAHSGDWANERADELAKEMAAQLVTEGCGDGFPNQAWCTACRQGFPGIADLAVHLKEVHMGRNVKEECLLEALANGSQNGLFECTMCERKMTSGFALKQHLLAKHSY